MILKKPYAFLIKHFKIIHLALCLVIIYITTNFQKIVDFYSDYTSTTNFVGHAAAGTYAPITVFIAVGIVLLFSALMFLLMREKKKPFTFYLLCAGYYTIMFFWISFSYNLIKRLEFSTIDEKTAMAYKDISTILFLVNFYFIVASAIRASGFDVKKFNFNKDLEELEIKKEDAEEFEFVLGNDSFKYKRKIRRYLRELKYYILENKFFVSIIGGAVALVVAVSILLNNVVFNRRYSVGSTIKTNEYVYKLNNAYLSAYDISGSRIKSDKKYVVLDMTVKSNDGQKKGIENAKFYLKKGNKVMNFKTSYVDSFSDIGTCYNNQKINADGANYIFIFEVDKGAVGSFTLRVFDKIKYDKQGNEEYKFKNFDFVPERLDKEVTIKTKELNKPITFNKDIFGSTTLTIKKVSLGGSYEYKYESCDENKENCKLLYDVQLPNNTGQNNILGIEYDLNIDKKSQIYRAIGDNEKEFFRRFVKLTFGSGNSEYITDINPFQLDKLPNHMFSDITKTIKKDNKTKLAISTRGEYYTIAF